MKVDKLSVSFEPDLGGNDNFVSQATFRYRFADDFL